MLCKEVIKIIERDYSPQYALEWDNVGLLAGRDDKDIKNIYVALDATDEAVDEAVRMGADLLLTHHPLIFSGMKRITNEDFIGNRIVRLIQNDISYYAMHTNYDVLGMADLSGEMLHLTDPDVLEVTSCQGVPEGIGRVAQLKESMTLRECCEYVKEAFHLDSVKVFGHLEQKVKRLAVSPGAGKSMIHPALESGADVLVTGDIDHHTGIDAVAQGLSVIDAGHYGLEYIFMEDIKEYLNKEIPEINVKTQKISHPFQVV